MTEAAIVIATKMAWALAGGLFSVGLLILGYIINLEFDNGEHREEVHQHHR